VLLSQTQSISGSCFAFARGLACQPLDLVQQRGARIGWVGATIPYPFAIR
jgi:hypothetical protein